MEDGAAFWAGGCAAGVGRVEAAGPTWLGPFTELTGIPAYVAPRDELSEHPPVAGNPLCRLLLDSGRPACDAAFRELCGGLDAPRLGRCFAGMTRFALPVAGGGAGGGAASVLWGGQVLTERPSRATWERAVAGLRRHGIRLRTDHLAAAFERSPVVPVERFNAAWQLLRGVVAEAAPAGQAPPDPIAKAKAFVRENVRRPITLADAARAVNLSEDYFSKRFRRATGERFCEFVQRVRLDRACELLRVTRASVLEIAFDSGFESIPYFNRVFKRRTGQSPRAYRKSSAAPDAADARAG